LVLGSSIMATGSFSVTANGNNPPKYPANAFASSFFNLTFELDVPWTYQLGGHIDCPTNLGAAFVNVTTLNGQPIFSITNLQPTPSFSTSGVLAAGQYIISGGASGTWTNFFPNTVTGDFVFQFALGSPAFQVTSLARQNNDVLLGWTEAAGATNVVQAANG